MSNKNIALAYCEDNANIAQKLVQYLASTDYQVEKLVGENFHQPDSNQHQLIASDKPILLVVSDNFLKSEACMNGALKMLQQLSKRGKILPIITDGKIWDEKKQDFLYKETSFEKVSNVIQYMNFWQERYLEVRRKKRHLKKGEEGTFNVKLKKVRSISSEVGEFLRHLRGLNFVPFEQLEKRQLGPFFKFMGDHKGLAAYKAQQITTAVPEKKIKKETLVKEAIIATASPAPADTVQTPMTAFQDAVNETHQTTEEDAINEAIEEVRQTKDKKQPNVRQEIKIEETLISHQNGHSSNNTWKNAEKIEVDIAESEPENKPKTINEDMILLEEIINGKPQSKTNPSTKKENLSAEASLEALENILSDHPTPQTNKTEDTNTIVLEEESAEIPSNNLTTETTDNLDAEANNSEKFIESLLTWMDTDAKETKNTEEDLVTEETNIVDTTIAKEQAKIEEITVQEEERQIFLAEEPLVVAPQTPIKSEIEDALVIIENSEPTTQEEVITTPSQENVETIVTVKEIEDISYLVNKAVAMPNVSTFILNKHTHTPTEQTNVKTTEIIEQTIEQNMPEQKPEEQTSSKIDDLFHQGKAAEEAEEYESAKKYYEKVANLDDNYPNIHVILGRLALYHFADAKEASKYYKKAIKMNPSNAEVHYQYANLLYEYAEKPYKAARHFKDTIKLQPDHPFANYDLALIYYQLGDKFRANRAYLKAIEINPELQTEQNDLAFGYAPQANIRQDNNTEAASKFQALQKDIQRLEQLLIANQTQVAQKKTVAIPTKTVFITGATSGIGRATAEVFAQNGYRLIITGRRKERLRVIKGFFKKNYQADILTLPFDVSDLDAVKEAVDGLADDWRQIDILINNAGLAKGISPIHEGDIAEWNTMIDTNIKGLLYMTRAITPHMVKRKSGHVINVCSTSGKEVYAGGNVYCATKFAVDALTKAMRIDLFQHNVRVSQVSPAHVEETEFSLVRFNGDNKKAEKVYENFRPLTPKDVAEAIYFMATRPPHVNVLDVVLQGTQQASSNYLDRSGR